MNISDIEVPGADGLYACAFGLFLLSVIMIIVAGQFLMRGRTDDKARKRAKKITFAIVAASALVFLGGACSAILATSHYSAADSNFARALQDTYGATSSVTYTHLQSDSTHEAWLTTGTKSTLVRFVIKDGTITPFEFLSTEFPRKTGS